MDGQRTLAFFHIMKCGGSSVRVGLSQAAAGRRHDPSIFELDGDAAKVATGGEHTRNWQFRDALLPYVVLAMKPALLLGHFRYRDEYESLSGSVDLVTVLRDPVERLTSLYKYRRYKDGVDLPVSMSFDDLLASGRWAKEGHDYVRVFCGRDGLDLRSDEAIAAAVANLRKFAVVGFTERLDEFADQVSSYFGTGVSMPTRNTSPAPASASDIDPDTLERARALCAPDIQVYEEALKMHAVTSGAA